MNTDEVVMPCAPNGKGILDSLVLTISGRLYKDCDGFVDWRDVVGCMLQEWA